MNGTKAFSRICASLLKALYSSIPINLHINSWRLGIEYEKYSGLRTCIEWTITVILTVILFIVGLAIGWFIKRK